MKWLYYQSPIQAFMQESPRLRRHLLWEYSLEGIDFHQLRTVVIERVIERGTLSEWKEIVRFYGKDEIQKVAEKSTRLDRKNKQFTPLFLSSEFLAA